MSTAEGICPACSGTGVITFGSDCQSQIVLTARNPVIGIDESFKGLENEELYMVIKALEELVAKNKTVVVVDHEEKAFKYFVNHIYLTNHGGILTTNDSL